MNQGNEEYTKEDYINAIDFYTEAIKVNCRDEELKAKLYSNRATVYFLKGEYFYKLVSLNQMHVFFAVLGKCGVPLYGLHPLFGLKFNKVCTVRHTSLV